MRFTKKLWKKTYKELRRTNLHKT